MRTSTIKMSVKQWAEEDRPTSRCTLPILPLPLPQGHRPATSLKKLQDISPNVDFYLTGMIF